jgi:hypothetical protein
MPKCRWCGTYIDNEGFCSQRCAVHCSQEDPAHYKRVNDEKHGTMMFKAFVGVLVLGIGAYAHYQNPDKDDSPKGESGDQSANHASTNSSIVPGPANAAFPITINDSFSYQGQTYRVSAILNATADYVELLTDQGKFRCTRDSIPAKWLD